jgi:hypothetical protein
MTRVPETDAVRRAERLLRWYPTSWRSRYGEEFAELLASELFEQPRSWRRTVNVAGSGMLARLTGAGLTNNVSEPFDQAVASLASLGCALAVFVAFGAAMVAQLTIGWQWAAPDTFGTATGMVVMSGVMVLFGTLAVLAGAPVVATVLLAVARRRTAGLRQPALVVAAAGTILVLGSRHFANGWPGTGGHPWAHQGLVPGGVAAFLWAATLSISSYWVHPGALLHFPAAEVAWMVVSPLALLAMAVGAIKIMRRLEISAAVVRYEGRLGRIAAGAMTLFLLGAWCWIVDGGPGPRNLFHAGAIDGVGLALMTVALVVAHRAARTTRRAGLLLVSG